MHNEMLQVEGKKMSKSLGNFFTVRDLLDQGIPGEVIRFVMLGTHYGKPMDWTEKKVAEATKTLRKWYEAAGQGGDVPASVVAALADDLNTHGAISEMHHLDGAELGASLSLLGLWTGVVPDWVATPTADLSAFQTRLAKARDAAMASKDFAPVDAMKAALLEAGVEVRMSKAGVELIPGPDFDPAKLEGL
jgi:cysteinyl-tRNA synthetase